MSIINRYLLIFALVIILPAPVFCGYGTAGTGIFNVEASARTHAMGGAAVGLADDLNALSSNPAGLIQLYGIEFSLTRLQYFEKTNMDSLAYGQKVGKFGLGAMIKLFRADDTYRDESGSGGEDFRIRFSDYRFAVGYQLSSRHSAGVCLHMANENYFLSEADKGNKDRGVSVFAADIGWLYRGRRGDSYGIAVKNIGADYQVVSDDIKLPLEFVMGGGHIMGRFTFAWEIFNSSQIDMGWRCGFQANIDGFKFRSGLMYLTKPDVVIGFGIPYRNWFVDYAFSPHQDMGIAHRVSLGAYF